MPMRRYCSSITSSPTSPSAKQPSNSRSTRRLQRLAAWWQQNEDLLDEVTNLVEQPAAIMCAFPPEYLDIPAPVLTSVMSKKQRYFTVLSPHPNPLPSDGGGRCSCQLHHRAQRAGHRHGRRAQGQRGCGERALCRCRLLLPRRHQETARGLPAAPRHDHLPGQARQHAGQDKAHRVAGRADCRPVGLVAG